MDPNEQQLDLDQDLPYIGHVEETDLDGETFIVNDAGQVYRNDEDNV